MKKISLILALVLCVSLLAGCAGTPVVYYTDCTCPAVDDIASGETVTPPVASIGNVGGVDGPTDVIVETQPAAEGALKTGLAITAGIGDSKSAAADAEGEGKYDVTMVAVLVDDAGVIQNCVIDGIAASVKFDAKGAITTDLDAPIQTKNELGENYNMVKFGGAVAEWDAQAAALAAFAVGKTVEELKSGAIDETGYAPEGTDLATSATIYLGGYVGAIEKAVANAQHLGAEAGHTLKLVTTAKAGSSAAATAEAAGNAQLDVDAAALTMNGDVISSCAIDSVQAKVAFDAAGVVGDVSAPVQTKNELGEKYGMVAYAGAVAEWNEQAASFASYVTGKTLAEVQGIAVDEGTKPTEADLATSVTIAIGGFQALLQKAA